MCIRDSGGRVFGLFGILRLALSQTLHAKESPMPRKSRPSRRKFLQAAAAGSSFLIMGTKASGNAKGANNRLRIAVCGLNRRGRAHVGGFTEQENVEVAYLVDPDARTWPLRKKQIAEKGHDLHTATPIRDIRQALDDPTLDAVTIATPNHWHSLITIWAAQAGKHVYVEKPMSHDISEGRVAVAAQKKYGVVIQHGTQRRSNPEIAGLSQMIKDDEFGRLKIAYGFCCKPRDPLRANAPATPPAELDWDLWKGPAVIEEFHNNYVPYNWHWFWNTGNGDLNNQGTHQLDIARWAIDDDQTHPTKAMAIGGRFAWDDQGETPNTMFSMVEYPNGQQIFFNVRNVKYEGYERQIENQYFFEDGGKIIGDKYFAKGDEEGEVIKIKDGDVTPGGNWAAFVAACRAGDPSMANADVEVAHRSCVVGHLMNNSYRLGEQVAFNKKAGKFGDNEDAAEQFGRLHDIMQDGVKVKDGAKYTVGPLLTFDPKKEKFTGEHSKAANKLVRDPHNPDFEVPTVKTV